MRVCGAVCGVCGVDGAVCVWCVRVCEAECPGLEAGGTVVEYVRCHWPGQPCRSTPSGEDQGWLHRYTQTFPFLIQCTV